MKKVFIMLLVVAMVVVGLTGCDQRQADDVSYNLSKQADNFNIVRQLTVINCIQGDIVFQMTGKLSIEVDGADDQLEIVVEDEMGRYQKHFVGLSDNVTYVVEDIRASDVSKYSYTFNFNPKMWLPDVEVID